ncbi:MAG TPA: hypothetical protein VMU89_10735 [Thermomicrobiaceae bacterium]|nr:hypothetical protein [Thermomicrobiaceae bacterium]
MARLVVARVAGHPEARELRVRFHRGVSQFWLVTEPLDFEAEERFYTIGHVLYAAFPDALIDFQVVNPAVFEPPFVADLIVPRDAERVPLRTQ